MGGDRRRVLEDAAWLWTMRGCIMIDLLHFFHKSKEQINMSRQRKARHWMNEPSVSAANLGR